MKFLAAISLAFLAATAAANTCTGDNCPMVVHARSLGFTQKPREWLNAARAAVAEPPTLVEAPTAA